METEELKNKQTKFLEEIKNQDKLNKSLKEEAMLQKQSCEELESDLSTKNKLVSLCYTGREAYIKTQHPDWSIGKVAKGFGYCS